MEPLSPEETALLATIAAHPDDDLPRLVYADFLDERDEPFRAELLRLQCRIAQHTGDRAAADREVGLYRRQQELLDDHLPQLLGPFAELGVAARPVFERGLLAELHLDWPRFAAAADRLAGLRPLPRVTLEARHADYEAWLTTPALETVQTLTLTDDAFREDEPADQPTFAEADLPAAWRRFPNLRTLSLANNGVGDQGVWAIPWADLSELVDLDLSNNLLSDAGVIDLINSGLPLRLKRLVLGGNRITDQSAFELADRVGRNQGLRNLNMRHTLLSNAGQNALTTRFGGRVDLF